jgi:hypothetical protein
VPSKECSARSEPVVSITLPPSTIAQLSSVFQEDIETMSICHICKIEAQTKYVKFVQHIGAVVVMFNKSIKGDLCRNCINKYFRKYTAITVIAGWWGLISFFVTPIALLSNIVTYLTCHNLQPVPLGASVPRLTQEISSQLQPQTNYIIARLQAGEQPERIAEELAPMYRVTPGQVLLYIYAITR